MRSCCATGDPKALAASRHLLAQVATGLVVGSGATSGILDDQDPAQRARDRVSIAHVLAGVDHRLGRSYDLAGNTLTGPGQSFGYDGRNLMTQVSSGGVVSSLAYDGEGRQVSATSGGALRRLHYGAPGDSGAVFETSSAGSVTAWSVVGPGGLLATGGAAGTRFVLADPKGSVAASADMAGAVTVAPLVDEYGMGGQGPYGYLGGYQKRTDPTGIVVMGARGYDPALGRFLQRDPIEGGCANDYVYVEDPVNQLDLTGTKCPKGIRAVVEFFSVSGYARAFRKLSLGDRSGALRELGLAVGGDVLKKGVLETLKVVARKSGRFGVRIAARVLGAPGAVAATAVELACGARRLGSGGAINGTSTPGAPGGFYNPGQPS
jgi:RHS repeat-associated protein